MWPTRTTSEYRYFVHSERRENLLARRHFAKPARGEKALPRYRLLRKMRASLPGGRLLRA